MDKRRTFSREFKLAAVKKVIKQGLSYTAFAKDLEIRDSLIRKWKKSFDQDGTFQAEVAGSHSIEAELKRLREENRQLKMERVIFKKGSLEESVGNFLAAECRLIGFLRHDREKRMVLS